MNIKRRGSIKFLVAVLIYIAFAVYLYRPYFKGFDKWQWLLIVNAPLGSAGCYLLSRRWVGGFCASFFSGAVYGFGPFVLWLLKFHPTAGLLAAVMPWLFCPSAFGPGGNWRWIRIPLVVLPFLAVLLFFKLATDHRLFAVSTQARLHLGDVVSLFAPLVMAGRGSTLIGFYHVPIAALVIGIFMLLIARRFSVMAVFAVGVILSFCNSLNVQLEVSPVMWLTIPVLCCSVIIGEGIQGLDTAGFSDRKWVLADIVVMGALAAVTLLLAMKYFDTFLGLGAKYARLFVKAGKMYILGAVTVAIIFFMTRARLRTRRVREILLCSAMAVDIFLGARFLVDKFL